MKSIAAKYKLELTGFILGTVAGWMYWYFVGCASGTCPITSSPVNSSLYGAMMGTFTLTMFKKETKEPKK